MSYELLKIHLIDMVKDLEKNSSMLHCFAYPKTIRSILTANENSPIACNFSNKTYYGIIRGKIPTKTISEILDELVSDGKLRSVIKNGKKLYISIDNNGSYDSDNIELSEADIDEIDSLLNL